jgi:hypothetical protein
MRLKDENRMAQRNDWVRGFMRGMGMRRDGWPELSPTIRGKIPDPDDDASASAVGRNDPCPCGSGKKYKQCCGDAAVN